MKEDLRRNVPIDRDRAALLLIDLQNYSLAPKGGAYREFNEGERDVRFAYFFDRIQSAVVPHVASLIAASRGAGIFD